MDSIQFLPKQVGRLCEGGFSGHHKSPNHWPCPGDFPKLQLRYNNFSHELTAFLKEWMRPTLNKKERPAKKSGSNTPRKRRRRARAWLIFNSAASSLRLINSRSLGSCLNEFIRLPLRKKST